MRIVLLLSLAALIGLFSAAPRAADLVIRNVMIASPEREMLYVSTSVATAAGTRNLPAPSADLIKRISAAADVRGLKVVLHANSHATGDAAYGPPVDVLAHGLWNARGDAVR